MTARSVRLLPFALACLLTAFALPAQSGTPEAPEVVDTPGDAQLPQLDIASAWFETNDTHLLVHIERGADSGTPPALVACQDGVCAGAGVSLRVIFTVLKPDGTVAPAIDGYNASYVLVRLGPDDPDLAAATGYLDAEGTPTVVSVVNVTVDGSSITVIVPRSTESIALPDGATPGAYRIISPYAISYVLACNPAQGCSNESAPVEQAASGWDRAPDAGFGLDFVFASPPPPPPAPAAKPSAADAGPASTTTVTVVQTERLTFTVTETATFTHTPFPLVSDAKGAPGLGLVALVAALVVGLLVRRQLA